MTRYRNVLEIGSRGAINWQPKEIEDGSLWFKRFYKECKQISPHIRFKRIKYGFYRMYFRNAYLHEAYKEMPIIGYDWEDLDARLDNREYFQEYEDRIDLTRKVKNYKEGYWDAIDRVRTRVYMMKKDSEYLKNAQDAYRQVKVH